VTRERHWLYALLFAATLLTTTVVGAAMQHDFERNLPFDVEQTFRTWSLIWRNPSRMVEGAPFSLTLLAILLAHEFGHYLACVYYRIDASLPYFLPSPFFGTFGAFIRIRSPIYSKRALFDVGIAGPLAGFVFLLPALGVGLAFSKVVPGLAQQSTLHFGVPALERVLHWLVFPGAASGDIYLHPVGRAAWIGIFATALNLLPIGQLDGGHILYARWPGAHRTVSKLLAICLIPMGWLWLGWLLWGAVLLWLGRRHPRIYDEAEIGPERRKLALLAFAIFLLCFMGTPIGTGGY
jgi:membrane-associated protease RseP (regulator of RpoE activity)